MAVSLATIALYIPSTYTVSVNAAAKESTQIVRPTDSREHPVVTIVKEDEDELAEIATAPARSTEVPFYSQFNDISAPSWRKVGCGIASLAMLIDFYAPTVAVDDLLNEGIARGAYVSDAGWSHAGLIALASDHGLSGEAHYLTDKSMAAAFETLKEAVEEGPVMVSVHYTFEPTNPIPHLVVITDIDEDTVRYNDPAEKTGGGSITIAKFQDSWKKRFIEIRPTS